MPDEKDQAGVKQTHKSRRLLNPRRVQSLLKRAQETLLGDSRDPKLTAQERIACLKAAAEYVKALGAADGRRRRDERANRAAEKKELADKSNSTWPW
jgi:hypothetical protein